MKSALTNRVAGIWHWALAFIDQAIVSGTRFLTTIIIGRFCGLSDLGVYSLAFSTLVLVGCFQEAIVTTPYAVLGQRLRRRSRASYGGAAAQIHRFVAIGGFLLLIGVSLAGLLLHIQTLSQIALMLALTLPASLVWEFARRFALAHLDVRMASRLDATVAALQLTLLLLLARLQWLAAPTALLAVGIACLLPSLIYLFQSRRLRAAGAAPAGNYWRRNWSLGRWLVASQIVATVHSFLPAWLLAMLVNTDAAGQFVACLNLALLANPLIFATGNLLTPRVARVLAIEGRDAVRNLVLRTQLGLSLLTGAFALVLALFGDQIVLRLYGASFANADKVAALLGLTAMVWAATGTFASGLAGLGRPRWSFLASGIGSIVSATSIVILAPQFSVLGTALGLLLGSSTSAAVQGLAFLRCTGGLVRQRVEQPSWQTQEVANA